uniref:Orf53 n=1 Tax=Moineauvirus Sfi21 TaxID=64186 RepID=O21864_9CAUD|nr:orf53 [Streptococcus phage Sfi21]
MRLHSLMVLVSFSAILLSTQEVLLLCFHLLANALYPIHSILWNYWTVALIYSY